MRIAVGILKGILICIYGVLKLLPTKTNKVLFLSRQSDVPSLDFTLLQEELTSALPLVEIKTICSRYADRRELPAYTLASFRSLYHLATSKVCVLDTYWPVVSLLRHKNELTIIQMWHALGMIKKTGYQALGSGYGRKTKTAQHMNMHRGYDYVIAGGPVWNTFYCESFNTTEDHLVNIGLPRIDYLLKTQESNKVRFFDTYPQVKNKAVILYAPTFRKSFDSLPYVEDLIKAIDFSCYALIIKAHPNQQISINNPLILECKDFEAIELLAVCDCVITDYSAIALEAAVLNKKTYYYLYDYESYLSNNGLNIDLPAVMEGCIFQDSASLSKSITNDEYPFEKLSRYKAMYLQESLGSSTKKLTSLISDNLND